MRRVVEGALDHRGGDHTAFVLDGDLQAEGHAEAVLAASIFHFGEYTVQQAKEMMRDAGLEVRL